MEGISAEVALDLHFQILRIRGIQEALMAEYHPADEMRCPVHFCVGQEATPAAIGQVLRKDDYSFSQPRSHGYFIAKGGSIPEFFAELYGKETGSNSGRAGSQEISEERINFFSGAILGGTLPMSAGVALSMRMRGQDSVVTSSLGDGGADEGILYETLNFAALKKLPVVFVCENNQFSAYSRPEARQVQKDLSQRAEAFGVEGHRVDGNDPIGLYKLFKDGVARMRQGGGPLFVESQTYRTCAHVGPNSDDSGHYRSKEEVEDWKSRCPLKKIEGQLQDAGLLDATYVEACKTRIQEEIRASFEFAKESPFPDPAHLKRYVFSDSVRGRAGESRSTAAGPFDHLQRELVPGPY